MKQKKTISKKDLLMCPAELQWYKKGKEEGVVSFGVIIPYRGPKKYKVRHVYAEDTLIRDWVYIQDSEGMKMTFTNFNAAPYKGKVPKIHAELAEDKG